MNSCGYHVFSVHATIARFDGDIEREREFHRYVDADIFDSEQRYHEHQRTALAAERDAAVLRAEQAERREAALLASSEEARQFLRQRDAMKAEIETMRSGALCAAVKPLEWEPSVTGKPWHSAKSPWGFYYAQWDDEIGAWFASLEMGEVEAPIILHPSDVSSIAEAKAAAQSDYERRILSALTIRPEAEVRNEGFALGARWAIEVAGEVCEHIRIGIANGPMPEGARFDYEQSVRAITPPTDAQAALDAIEARVRAEVVEEAKMMAESLSREIDAIDAAYDGPDEIGAYSTKERAALAAWRAKQ